MTECAPPPRPDSIRDQVGHGHEEDKARRGIAVLIETITLYNYKQRKMPKMIIFQRFKLKFMNSLSFIYGYWR